MSLLSDFHPPCFLSQSMLAGHALANRPLSCSLVLTIMLQNAYAEQDPTTKTTAYLILFPIVCKRIGAGLLLAGLVLLVFESRVHSIIYKST